VALGALLEDFQYFESGQGALSPVFLSSSILVMGVFLPLTGKLLLRAQPLQ